MTKRTFNFFVVSVLLFPLCALKTVCAQATPAAPAASSPPSYADAPEIRRLLHWEHFPLHLYFSLGDLATEGRKEAVQAGFDQWVHATHDFVRYQVVAKPEQADVTVTFLPNDSVQNQGGSCGHTSLSFFELTMKSATISLATAEVPSADLQATAAHEFGHALGIDGHSDDPDDLMYAVLTRSASGDLPLPSHAVTTRDLNTLKVCYPGLAVLPPTPAKPGAESAGAG